MLFGEVLEHRTKLLFVVVKHRLGDFEVFLKRYEIEGAYLVLGIFRLVLARKGDKVLFEKGFNFLGESCELGVVGVLY